MLKPRNDFLVIFCIGIALLIKPISYEEMRNHHPIDSQVSCIRPQREEALSIRGGWINPEKECPNRDKAPSYRNTQSFANKGLPDLPVSREFPDDSDSGNELAWSKKKNDPAAWNDYQNYCAEQSRQGEKCNLFEIVSRINKDTQLIKYAEKAGKNQRLQKELNDMSEKLRLGNEQCGKGRRTLFRNVKELRGYEGGQLYYRMVDGKIEILAKSSKVRREQQKVIDILKRKY